MERDVGKRGVAHLTEAGRLLGEAFLAAASLAEELVVGHEWYADSTGRIKIKTPSLQYGRKTLNRYF